MHERDTIGRGVAGRAREGLEQTDLTQAAHQDPVDHALEQALLSALGVAASADIVAGFAANRALLERHWALLREERHEDGAA